MMGGLFVASFRILALVNKTNAFTLQNRDI